MNRDQVMQLEVLENQQENQLTELLGVLEEEFTALKHRRMNDLTLITQRKSELLEIIHSIDEDITSTLKKNKDASIQPDKKARMKAKLEHCQYQNEINGNLLELSLMTNRRFAHFFMHMRDEGSLTYDAKGNTSLANKAQSFKI